MILAWPQHLRVNCQPDKDGYLSDACAAGSCPCGNLFMCKRCGGAEGSLPTDCPGEKITREQADAIYAGKLNYTRQHGWLLADHILFKENC